jgi:hypothetical protein
MRPAAALLAVSLLAAFPTAAQENCSRALSVAERIVTANVKTSISAEPATYADFNGDGRLDVAFIDESTRVVALNRGSLFDPAFAGSVPQLNGVPTVRATDLNGDGRLDLLYRDAQSHFYLAELGRGDGTFSAIYTPYTRPQESVLGWADADFDHDGRSDFVEARMAPSATDAQTIRFLRAAGDGTLKEVANPGLARHGLATQKRRFAFGDFDGNGTIDVMRFEEDLPGFFPVMTIGWTDAAYAITQKELTPPVSADTEIYPADVDGDGASELIAVANGVLFVMRARNGELTTERLPFGLLTTITNPVAIDFDADGRRDLVFVYGSAVGIARGRAGGGYDDPQLFQLPDVRRFSVVDLDGDGLLDIATRNGRDGLYVLHGRAFRAGAPDAPRTYPGRLTPSKMQWADVNADGIADIVAIGVIDFSTLWAEVQYGDGSGGFRQGALRRLLSGTEQISAPVFVAADFDGDGAVDLAHSRSSGKAAILFGDGHGDFGPDSTALDADAVIGADAGGAAPPRLVVRRGNDVQLLSFTAARAIQSETIYTMPQGATAFLVDADGDGRNELAVSARKSPESFVGSVLRIVARSATGWKEIASAELENTSALQSIDAGDLDGDGRRDLVVSAFLSNYFLFRTSSGYRFANGVGLALWSSVVDFDRDGLPDLVTSGTQFGGAPVVRVLRNRGGGSFEDLPDAATGGTTFLTGDVDGDGWTDVVTAALGVAVLRNNCARPRMRVAVTPSLPQAGERVLIVVAPITKSVTFPGGVRLLEEGKEVAFADLGNANAWGTLRWTSPPLPKGPHTFTARYVDGLTTLGETTFVVYAGVAPPRRRSTHH